MVIVANPIVEAPVAIAVQEPVKRVDGTDILGEQVQ